MPNATRDQKKNPTGKEDSKRTSGATISGNPEATDAGKSNATDASKSKVTTAGKSKVTTAGKSKVTTAGKSKATTAGKSRATTAGQPEATTAGQPEATAAGKSEATTASQPEATTSVGGNPQWSQITGLSLENFKRFKALSDLNLSPLTVLTGPNSSGKSTIIQSLVLLKQSLEVPGTHGALVFNELIQLGSGQRVLCKHSDATVFSIGLTIDFSDVSKPASKDLDLDLEKVIVKWTFLPSEVGTQTEGVQFLGVDQKGAEISLASIKRMAPNSDSGQAVHKLFLEHEPLRKGVESFIERVIDDKSWSQPDFDIGLKKFLPQTVEVVQGTTHHFMPFVACSPLFSYILPILEKTLTSHLHYIGPLRAEPSEMYAQNSRRIGVRGEDSIAYLRANSTKIVSNALPDGASATLLDAVNAWLVVMEAGDDLKFSPLGDRFFEAITGDRRLNEVGCGLGQVLPVLIQCLAATPRSIVLLEQPEIHLHQKLQAHLADFLLQMARRGVRIVAETHSELLIMRLRRRIAESRGELAKYVSVHFASDGNFKKIPIDVNGNVGMWPSNFFDQGLFEMRALAKVQAENHQ